MEKKVLSAEAYAIYKSKFSGEEVDERLDGVQVNKEDIDHLEDEIRLVNERVDGKQNAIPGKGLSTNDYTNTDKNKLGELPTAEELAQEMAEKADKVIDAVPGHLAGLDEKGNLIDSGYDAESLVVVNQSFPDSWRKDGSMADLIEDINNDDSAIVGKSYLSTVYLRDLPGLVQAEMKVEIMDVIRGLGKVILFTITSADTYPYHWEYTSAYHRLGEWISFESNSNKTQRINSRSTEAQYPSAKAVYDLVKDYTTVNDDTLVFKSI